jgi:hypothetical protein
LYKNFREVSPKVLARPLLKAPKNKNRGISPGFFI